MEFIALDVERLHLGIADFDALFVGRGIERALDFQAGFGRRRRNQFDHGHAIDEWSPTPGLRDVAEQAMLDLIPLRRARRIMMDVEHEARLVGELWGLVRLGRVEEWRGCLGPEAIAPFPLPAHRTGRADFPHPALRLASP